MTLASEPAASATGATAKGAARTRWLAAAIFIIAAVTFSPILVHNFLPWDDGVLITEDPDINPPVPSHWGHYWIGPTKLYMPLTHVTWGVLALVSATPHGAGEPASLNPGLFHGVSLLLHAANAAVVFLVLRRLATPEPAWIGALIFAVHPLQTESVAWAAELSILLSGLFSLLAILAFMRFTEAHDAHKGGTARLCYLFGTIALLLALCSKPSAVVTPVLVLVIEVLVRRRPLRGVALPLAFWLLVCAPIAYITHLWQTTTLTVPLWQRPIVAADALAFYFWKLVAPVHLLAVYGRTPRWLMAHPIVAATTWLVPAALALLGAALVKKVRWVLASELLVVAGLLPVLGLNVFVYQHLSTVADRYMYLPMLGVGLAVACALSLSRALWTRVAAFSIAAIFMGLSMWQSTLWSDSLSLFTPVINVHPEIARAQEQVAIAYNLQSHSAADPASKREMLEQAVRHFHLAAALPEDDGKSYFNAADCLARMGKPHQAIDDLRAALRDPNFDLRGKAYDLMGVCYLQLKDTPAAIECFRKAIQASESAPDDGIHQLALEHLQRLQRSMSRRPS